MVGFALRRSKLVQETMQLSQLIKWKKEKKTIVTPLLAFSFTPSTVLVVPLVQFYRFPELFISAVIVHIEFFSFNSICTNLIKKRFCAKKVLTILTLTAMPLRSEEAEAAVWVVLGTVFVFVSLIMILDAGIPKHLAATCKNMKKESWNLSLCRHVLYNLTLLVISVTWRYKQEQLTRLTNISPAPFWCVVLGPFLFRHELKELIRLCKHATELQPE